MNMLRAFGSRALPARVFDYRRPHFGVRKEGKGMGGRFSRRVIVLSEEDRQLLRDLVSHGTVLSEKESQLLRDSAPRETVLTLSDHDRQTVKALFSKPTGRRRLRSWEFWSRVGKFVGGALVLVSLGLALRQVAISTKAANTSAKAVNASAKAAQTAATAVQASALASADTAALQTDQAFAQSDPTGALEPYFDKKVKIPASDLLLYRRFERLAVMQLHLMNLYIGASRLLSGTYLDPAALRRWLWGNFAHSPDLCKVLDAQQASYSDYFVTEATSACSQSGYKLTPHRPPVKVDLWNQ